MSLLSQDFHPFPCFSIPLFPLGLSLLFWQLLVELWGEGLRDFTYCEISFFSTHLRGPSGCLQTQPLPKDQIKYLGAEVETMACLCST